MCKSESSLLTLILLSFSMSHTIVSFHYVEVTVDLAISF